MTVKWLTIGRGCHFNWLPLRWIFFAQNQVFDIFWLKRQHFRSPSINFELFNYFLSCWNQLCCDDLDLDDKFRKTKLIWSQYKMKFGSRSIRSPKLTLMWFIRFIIRANVSHHFDFAMVWSKWEIHIVFKAPIMMRG